VHPRLTAFAKLGLFLSVPTLLCSCGGANSLFGGSTSYTGTWAGTATGNGATNVGMSLTIDANNNVTGTDNVGKPGTQTVDTGSISSSGDLNLQISNGGTVIGSITAQVVVGTGGIAGTSVMTTSSGSITVNGVTGTFSMNLVTNNAGLLRQKQ
jgi:hypothetical protein